MLRGRDVNLMAGVEILGRAALMRISSAHLAACINNTMSRSAIGTS